MKTREKSSILIEATISGKTRVTRSWRELSIRLAHMLFHCDGSRTNLEETPKATLFKLKINKIEVLRVRDKFANQSDDNKT